MFVNLSLSKLMGKSAEDTFDEIQILLEGIEKKLENKVSAKEESKKKNSHLHIFIETSLLNKLKREAKENEMSLSELCRKKLRGNSQLDRIEKKLDKVLKRKISS